MRNQLNRYFLGLDLGQSSDFTALAVLERRRVHTSDPVEQRRPPFSLRHMERFSPGTHYPVIIDRCRDLLHTDALKGGMLIVDQTGVGHAVTQLVADGLRNKATCQFCTAIITAGQEVMMGESGFLIPKKELISTLQVLLHTQRLQVAKSMSFASLLVKEMENFRMDVRISEGEDAIAWREGQHDDLVLGVALAAWMGERSLPPLELPTPERLVGRVVV